MDGHHAGRPDRGLVHELWLRQADCRRARRISATATRTASSRRRPPITAAGSSALLPMLALGVPGSATAAVMLGGLMIWGLQPRPDAVRRAQAGLRLGPDRHRCIWATSSRCLLVLATVPLFASILRIPFAIIGPVIVVVCLIGAYTVAGAQSSTSGTGSSALASSATRLQEAGLPARADGAGRCMDARRQNPGITVRQSNVIAIARFRFLFPGGQAGETPYPRHWLSHWRHGPCHHMAAAAATRCRM